MQTDFQKVVMQAQQAQARFPNAGTQTIAQGGENTTEDKQDQDQQPAGQRRSAVGKRSGQPVTIVTCRSLS